MIDAQQYVADSAAAATAVSDFMSGVEALGTEPTPAQLRSASAGLQEPLDETAAYAEKLSAARLNDARLEAQRAKVAEALTEVVESMDRLAGFAAGGDRLRASSMTVQLAVRADALRQSVEDS